MTLKYPVIVRKYGNKYRADFPDLPFCYGEGRDVQDALDDARACGVEFVRGAMEDGDDLPHHTLPEDIKTEEGETVFELGLTLPREEGWDWLG